MGVKKHSKLFLKLASKLCVTACLMSFANHSPAYAGELRGSFSYEMEAPLFDSPIELISLDIDEIKKSLSHLRKSPQLLVEVDKIIDLFNENAPLMTRVPVELYKLDILSKGKNFSAAADLAGQIYASHPRSNYPSDKEFGDTMYQIVESLARTDNLGVSYDIIQKLSVSLLNKPNDYLSFILNKSLIEVYIETSDFQRALELTLLTLEDPNYSSLAEVENWRPTAINEIAYLYNKLGDGEKALIYLEKSAEITKTKDQTLKKVRKAVALNYANRGRAYLLTKNYEAAEDMGRKVAIANQSLSQDYLLAVSHRLIGSSAYQLSQYDKAARELKAGIDLTGPNDNLSLRCALYGDYAHTLEKLNQNKSAIHWYKMRFDLELLRQQAVVSTRAKLSDIELNAFKNHQDVVHLQHELERGKAKGNLMFVTILSLLSGGAILIWILLFMRKAQKNIISSEKKALAANQAKSDFLANMSHEIRTPMNGVLGMAQVLEQTNLTGQQKYYLDIVKKSGVELLAVINDILDFSKIEADKMPLHAKACDLKEIIQDVATLLTPCANEKNVELSYEFSPELPENYLVDSHRFRQIITNLVGNAIKFTSQGSVTINVSGHVTNDIAQLQIQVIDTGIGIEENKVSTVFEKFTQAEDSTTRTHGGTGLGLAISRKLAEAMQGKLSATSELGKGSTFTLDLPLKVVSKPTRVSSVTPEELYQKTA